MRTIRYRRVNRPSRSVGVQVVVANSSGDPIVLSANVASTWQFLTPERTESEIKVHLSSTFSVPLGEMDTWVEEILNMLISEGLVEVCGD